jgi:hypothetical protein
VPRRTATQWVEQDALGLLLDGLDEVADAHRTACAEAVNTWRHDHGLVPMVVCGRTQELQALGARLRLEEAVELQPPSDADVDRYLGYLEATGTPIQDVRGGLTSDLDLRQLLRSPLLLPWSRSPTTAGQPPPCPHTARSSSGKRRCGKPTWRGCLSSDRSPPAIATRTSRRLPGLPGWPGWPGRCTTATKPSST